jgi:hypothetical protein
MRRSVAWIGRRHVPVKNERSLARHLKVALDWPATFG